MYLGTQTTLSPYKIYRKRLPHHIVKFSYYPHPPNISANTQSITYLSPIKVINSMFILSPSCFAFPHPLPLDLSTFIFPESIQLPPSTLPSSSSWLFNKVPDLPSGCLLPTPASYCWPKLAPKIDFTAVLSKISLAMAPAHTLSMIRGFLSSPETSISFQQQLVNIKCSTWHFHLAQMPPFLARS